MDKSAIAASLYSSFVLIHFSRSIQLFLLLQHVSHIISFGSTCSLKKTLSVGDLLLPDDFIDFCPQSTFDYAKGGHVSVKQRDRRRTHKGKSFVHRSHVDLFSSFCVLSVGLDLTIPSARVYSPLFAQPTCTCCRAACMCRRKVLVSILQPR